jgi:hypothetical protein
MLSLAAIVSVKILVERHQLQASSNQFRLNLTGLLDLSGLMSDGYCYYHLVHDYQNCHCPILLLLPQIIVKFQSSRNVRQKLSFLKKLSFFPALPSPSGRGVGGEGKYENISALVLTTIPGRDGIWIKAVI